MYSISNPAVVEFLDAQSIARGLISTAVTFAPLRAANKPMIPDPVPISRNVLPAKSSDCTYCPRIKLLPKYLGWKTVGKMQRSKPATRVLTSCFAARFNQYRANSGCAIRRRCPEETRVTRSLHARLRPDNVRMQRRTNHGRHETAKFVEAACAIWTRYGPHTRVSDKN